MIDFCGVQKSAGMPKAACKKSGTGGGTSGRLIPEVRGTRGSLPEGTSQPDDPGGVGGFKCVCVCVCVYWMVPSYRLPRVCGVCVCVCCFRFVVVVVVVIVVVV